MWFKILGAAAIILSSYIMGLYFSKVYLFRLQDLEQMKKAATIFQGEILYSATPLEEVFQQISIRTTGAVSAIFERAAEEFMGRRGISSQEIWEKSVAEERENSYFNAEDTDNFLSFGRTLGFADKTQQAKNADLLINYIDNAQQEAREKRKTDERLYKTMGLLGGVMVCVILF